MGIPDNTPSFRAFCIFLALVFILPSCGKAPQAETSKEKQLLIYCGITMVRPISEIKEIIEKRENCRIVVTKGGSGNLLESLELNKQGDLFLPGSDSYIEKAKKEGLVMETALVGYNKAAMMVQKGNPKNIPADLDMLADKSYYVVLGNPDSGSVGHETKKILSKKGIYEKVISNARELTTDSKRLVQVLAEKKADLVINWYATACWPENKDFVDVLPISSEFAETEKLVLGVLKFSQNPDIAKKFLDFASSEEGKAIFNKYGLYEIK